jgi:hypothetical protein
VGETTTTINGIHFFMMMDHSVEFMLLPVIYICNEGFLLNRASQEKHVLFASCSAIQESFYGIKMFPLFLLKVIK